MTESRSRFVHEPCRTLDHDKGGHTGRQSGELLARREHTRRSGGDGG